MARRKVLKIDRVLNALGGGLRMGNFPLSHSFVLTGCGAVDVQHYGGTLLSKMLRGESPGLICSCCGMSLADVIIYGVGGGTPVGCQPPALRLLSVRRAAEQGMEPPLEDVVYMDSSFMSRVMGQARSNTSFSYGASLEHLFKQTGFIPVLLPDTTLGLMPTPRMS